MASVRAHVFITGDVQGVGYRFYARQEMKALGIGGWIRNLDDGRVEAIFEGEESKVRKMIDWCFEGSPVAQVRDVQYDLVEI